MPLNVNGLNSPIKRHRMIDYIWKANVQIFVVYKRHTSLTKTLIRKAICQASRSWKQAGVAIFTSDKIEPSHN
jgi:hypothetical protein